MLSETPDIYKHTHTCDCDDEVGWVISSIYKQNNMKSMLFVDNLPWSEENPSAAILEN